MKNLFREVLAGFVSFLALLPEALGFTLIAGVEPIYGIIGTFFLSFVTSIFRARPGMISGAAGATALVLASVVSEHGPEYLLWVTLLAGVIQISLFKINFDKLLYYITPAITFGFLNGLGILMIISQLNKFSTPLLICLGIITVAIILIFRKSKLPSPIIALAVMTIITVFFEIPRLGDTGEIKVESLKIMLDFSLEVLPTLKIIILPALSVAFIGLLESMLTAKVIEEKIDNGQSRTNTKLITISQGLGNILNGFFGGIAGCGMIGQSILNTNSGGRQRLSTFIAGFCFLFFALVASNVLAFLPLFALGSIVLVIGYETFSTESLISFRQFKLIEIIVIISVTALVVITHNLFIGVLSGLIITGIYQKINQKEQING